MRRISHCLNPKLIDICQSVVQLEALNGILAHYLPTHFQQHCRIGSFSRGTLNLVTSDSGWATQLRYLLPEIRDKLRKEAGLFQLVSIKITLDTKPVLQTKTKPKCKTRISEKSRQIILDTSLQCQHLPLQEALIKLGTT